MRDRRDDRGTTGNGGSGTGTGVVAKTRPKTKKPSLYKVLILNDDYTPMEFVVHILEKFFNKAREQAVEIMLHVHRHGVGVCGVFTFEVAETKVAQVIEFSRRHQHPLQCTMEKE
jgi:ATP-dependent Clp protease adaptor protein ClpS